MASLARPAGCVDGHWEPASKNTEACLKSQPSPELRHLNWGCKGHLCPSVDQNPSPKVGTFICSYKVLRRAPFSNRSTEEDVGHRLNAQLRLSSDWGDSNSYLPPPKWLPWPPASKVLNNLGRGQSASLSLVETGPLGRKKIKLHRPRKRQSKGEPASVV